ncbi:CoF synthetase [Spongiivirga sp. MCCC 1A20706]|uniref:CoF synthetase n=1 Tax=Spongiivirga sp. MCCC 1A20706 TaxID=3160963 RepID=UPI003977544B
MKYFYQSTAFIRKFAFYAFDALKGRIIGKHLTDINSHFENPAESKNSRETLLLNLLSHTFKTVDYYAKLEGISKLSDYPVVTKSHFIDHFDSFISSQYKDTKLFKMTTSGSTGIPLLVLQNKQKKDRNTADTIYFAKRVGVYVGVKLLYIKLWSHKNKKSKLSLAIQNIMPHNILDSDKSHFEKLLYKMNRYSGKMNMIVYPSFLEQLCQHLEKKDVELPKIGSLITISEKLNKYERQCAEKLFGARVYERYSNMENGILAQEDSTSCYYTVNTASYIVEMLHPEYDVAIAEGEVGRIVITDLFNYAMPMIRYDTGDMAIAKTLDDGRLVFTEIFGRKMDVVYDTNGKYVSPHIFYMISKFSVHKQFQFIQNGKKTYCFKLNATPEKTNENAMVDYFKAYLGNDAVFSFEYVDEIPLLASGKRKKVENRLSSY